MSGEGVLPPMIDRVLDRDVELERLRRRVAELEPLRRRVAELEHAINSPETADFMRGVPLEAAHQSQRWGAEHDAGKTAWDWFWLVGYLAQKAAVAAIAGDVEKARHHCISTAGALANWHRSL